MNMDTELDNKSAETDQFYVQAQPLIQYGPLTLSQLKELYLNDVIDSDTLIASHACLSDSKNKDNLNGQSSFKIIPNETPLWSPIRSIHTIHTELGDHVNGYNKRNSAKSEDSKSNSSNVNVQFNINGTNTMDINMNITNASSNSMHSNPNKNNITRKQIESLKFEIKLLEQKNKNLRRINKDLQKETTVIKVKYQSQFENLKKKMLKQFEEYKIKKKEQQSVLQSEITRLKTENRNGFKNNMEISHIITENEQISAYNHELKKRESKLINEMSQLNLNILYYKTQYKALQTKCDLETFNYDKYLSNISELKEQILHKQSIIRHSHQIVNTLLKNTISDLIPYNADLREIEGKHHTVTNTNKEIIRFDALKIGELLAWHNYAEKFHLAMDLLSEYELTSRRSRSRMKTVVNMLGEKVKSLNIHNLTPSELIHLSRDLKQSFESISSEQHLKEYELSNQRREFMKHASKPTHIHSATTPRLTPMMTTITPGTSVVLGDEINDLNYGVSFSSMASLSMMDIQTNDQFSRHLSLSPSLDGAESIITKHRTKSGTIKGSGLKLLTDSDTLSKYLDPTQNKENMNAKQRRINRRRNDANNRSISRSKSHRQLHQKRENKIYNHYSAFKKPKRRHKPNSSISSNRSIQSSVSHTMTYTHRTRKENGSINSISALSQAGNLRDINESYDEEDVYDNEENDTGSVIMKTSPKRDLKITFGMDSANDDALPENKPQFNDKELSNDILSFFAM